MNTPLKITKIGNSAGVILPKELLAHLNTAVGETLSVVLTPRGIELSAARAGFRHADGRRPRSDGAPQTGAARARQVASWLSTGSGSARRWRWPFMPSKWPSMAAATAVRDAGLLESAIARPQNRAVYGGPDAAELAAAYAFGIARNHPFVDGNKRTAAVVGETFLMLNGCRLDATDADWSSRSLPLPPGISASPSLPTGSAPISRRPDGFPKIPCPTPPFPCLTSPA